MICSSVNFDLFMSGPLIGTDSSIRWTSYRGSQQGSCSPGKQPLDCLLFLPTLGQFPVLPLRRLLLALQMIPRII